MVNPSKPTHTGEEKTNSGDPMSTKSMTEKKNGTMTKTNHATEKTYGAMEKRK